MQMAQDITRALGMGPRNDPRLRQGNGDDGDDDYDDDNDDDDGDESGNSPDDKYGWFYSPHSLVYGSPDDDWDDGDDSNDVSENDNKEEESNDEDNQVDLSDEIAALES